MRRRGRGEILSIHRSGETVLKPSSHSSTEVGKPASLISLILRKWSMVALACRLSVRKLNSAGQARVTSDDILGSLAATYTLMAAPALEPSRQRRDLSTVSTLAR